MNYVLPGAFLEGCISAAIKNSLALAQVAQWKWLRQWFYHLFCFFPLKWQDFDVLKMQNDNAESKITLRFSLESIIRPSGSQR